MPKYEKPKNSDGGGNNGNSPANPIPGVIEPRCHACQSKFRKAIDRLIAQGTTPYIEIGRIFDIDRRSISNHAKHHLGWEEAAIRRIVEQQAKAADADLEEGIQGALTRRVYLSVAIQKALDALLSDDVTVEPKDALAVIQHLDKLDAEVESAGIDELHVQFNSFVQAIREICAPEMWQQILDRTREILENTVDAPALQPPDDS